MTSLSRPDIELIIGGAGFIGSNLAARLAAAGRQVLVFDNFSRAGSEHNAAWLRHQFPSHVQLLQADVRDADAVAHAVADARRIFHFAAQVAVTTSLAHPLTDHAVNTLGTLNVLEAMRRQPEPPSMVFTSTNKVYGNLPELKLQHTACGYEPVDATIRTQGIDESRPLAFCSPYGCSKGAADQYVLDYARTFGLPTAVLRMSCIYGPRQFGNEDQGWVAHFARQALLGRPITLYGNGYQVRDILYVDDLINAVLSVSNNLPGVSGEAFNVGGGPFNKVSLRSLLDRLAALQGGMPPINSAHWRPGDQRYYVSNTARLQRLTGWSARINVGEGIRRLYAWMRQHLDTTATPSKNGERQLSP
ncbi:MAG: NAD-dependent epimerase/dehydratase family protein [Aquisalimonadaceae bacterium]